MSVSGGAEDKERARLPTPLLQRIYIYIERETFLCGSVFVVMQVFYFLLP